MLSSPTNSNFFYSFHGINTCENLSCCTACDLFDGSNVGVKVKFVASVEFRYKLPLLFAISKNHHVDD